MFSASDGRHVMQFVEGLLVYVVVATASSNKHSYAKRCCACSADTGARHSDQFAEDRFRIGLSDTK
jgi:hypothetical protein